MKKLVFLSLLILLVLGTVACGASVVSPRGNLEGDGKSVGSPGSGITTPLPTVTAIPRPSPTATVPPSLSGGAAYDGAYTAERMVILSAYLSLVVDDVSASITQISTLAGSFGGYVVSSNLGEQQNRLYANISFRVDAVRFNEALQALRDLAVDVRSESTSGQDVTEEYVDLDARLRNLEASEAQLLELMTQAGTVDEILKVQQRLVSTREEIEQTRGRMQYLEQSSALSYFEVSLEQSRLTVEFSATARTVKEGENIQFDPEISGGFEPYSYSWDFGDGQTSTEYRPLYSYESDGVYTVTLTVTDDRGNVELSTRTDYITVLAGWSAGDIAGGAWNGLVGFGRVLLNILIWLGIFSPLWIAILLILYFTWWRKREKKAQ